MSYLISIIISLHFRCTPISIFQAVHIVPGPTAAVQYACVLQIKRPPVVFLLQKSTVSKKQLHPQANTRRKIIKIRPNIVLLLQKVPVSQQNGCTYQQLFERKWIEFPYTQRLDQRMYVSSPLPLNLCLRPLCQDAVHPYPHTAFVGRIHITVRKALCPVAQNNIIQWNKSTKTKFAHFFLHTWFNQVNWTDHAKWGIHVLTSSAQSKSCQSLSGPAFPTFSYWVYRQQTKAAMFYHIICIKH